MLVCLLLAIGKYGKNDINKKFNKKYQMLTSYKLKFNFVTPSYELEYLNNKEFTLKQEKINQN